ncbi:MAG: hypothetical protein GXO32_01275 [Crenarchaeota archaeon]|nr:hypothetical protein [Thermoproteota archaeon]
MGRGRSIVLALIPLASGVLTLATPIAVYYSTIGAAYRAFEGGILSLAAVLVAKAAIATSCVPPALATIGLAIWCSVAVFWERNANPLLATLAIIAALLAIVQSGYYAFAALSSSTLAYAVSIRVSKVISLGVAHAYSYALRLCSGLSALCSTSSAVLGAALLGLALIDRKVGHLPRITRALTYATTALCIVRTAVALLTPSAAPIGTTALAALSIALGASVLTGLRKA